MTARPVNRTILGSGGQMGIGESLMLQEKARYEEFRRQHAKQNRDLVRVNTQRLEEIQSLKAEKDGLQAIILEERAEKAALAAELKKTRDELARVRNDSTREALDTLLAVVPTLRQLRQKLDANPANPLLQRRSDPGNRYVRVDPYEDRVFVAASGQTNLADLTERTERETESDSGSVLGVNGSIMTRARSASASPNAKNSTITLNRRRLVSAQEQPSPLLRTEESPVSSIKPLALHIDPPAPQPRKRRISGIDNDRRASASPDKGLGQSAAMEIRSALPPPTVPAQRLASVIGGGESSGLAAPAQSFTKPSASVLPESADVGGKARKRTSISTIVTSVPARQDSSPDSGSPSQAEPMGQNQQLTSMPQKRGQAEHESTLMQMAGRNSLGRMENIGVNVEEDEEGENGGRQTRRARKSVNYKEPSLHTKMRKPDGQGKLNVPASTGRSRTPSRQRSQSTDTPTPTPHSAILPLDFGSSQIDSNTPPPPTGLMRLQEKMAKKDILQTPELSQAAVRRKSVLPKSGRGAEVIGRNLEPTMARLAIRTPYVASETVLTKGMADTGKDRLSPSAETGNAETTSSRRRLGQLSINALPDHDARDTLHAGLGPAVQSSNNNGDKAKALVSENIVDIATQKARLGRRRSSLFKPTDM